MQQTFHCNPFYLFRAIKLSICLSLSVVFVTGCWDRKEINKLILITAVGLDQADDGQIELSIQIVLPRNIVGGQSMSGSGSGASGAGPKTIMRIATGVTIADAAANLQKKLPMKIFWGHGDVFIIGEKVARFGVREHLDYFLRNSLLKERGYVFIAQGNAKDFLDIQPVIEVSSADILKRFMESGTALKVKLSDLAQMLTGEARTAVVPSLGLMTLENNQKSAFINGTAIFQGDRMSGRLDLNKTQGILWMRSDIRPGTVMVNAPFDKRYVSVELITTKTKLQPKIENGEWSVAAEISASGNIVQNTTAMSSVDDGFYRKVETEVQKVLEQRIQAAIDVVKDQKKIDVLGFADAFHRRYPAVWKKTAARWMEVFPDVQTKLQVNVHLLRPGIIIEENSIPRQTSD